MGAEAWFQITFRRWNASHGHTGTNVCILYDVSGWTKIKGEWVKNRLDYHYLSQKLESMIFLNKAKTSFFGIRPLHNLLVVFAKKKLRLNIAYLNISSWFKPTTVAIHESKSYLLVPLLFILSMYNKEFVANLSSRMEVLFRKQWNAISLWDFFWLLKLFYAKSK